MIITIPLLRTSCLALLLAGTARGSARLLRHRNALLAATEIEQPNLPSTVKQQADTDGCLVLTISLKKADLEDPKYVFKNEAINNGGLVKLPVYDEQTMRQIGVLDQLYTVIPDFGSERGCIGTAALGFGSEGNDFTESTIIFTFQDCQHNHQDAIVGGTGAFLCATGSSSFVNETNETKAYALTFCDAPCPN